MGTKLRLVLENNVFLYNGTKIGALGEEKVLAKSGAWLGPIKERRRTHKSLRGFLFCRSQREITVIRVDLKHA